MCTDSLNAQSTTMSDAGLARVADAMNAADWALAAMVNAETQAKHVGPVFVDHFGVLFEVVWTDACCQVMGWDCRPAHYTYWHEGARRNREYLMALLTEAAITDARNVAAAMEVGS